MAKHLIRLVCFLYLSLASSSASSVEIIDDAGNLVVLETPAQRIISLAPALTELLFAAGAGNHVVGVVEYSDYPAAALDIPVVGRHDLLDLERILSLEADLIVAWQSGNPRASVEQLQSLGLTVYVAEPRSLESIPSHIQRLAQLAGTEAVANPIVQSFHSRLNALQDRYSHSDPVSVFYQVWDVPLITSGGNELINDIITLCGGQNIFREISLIAPKVSVEAVLQRNPKVIVASGMDVERPEWLDDWLNWQQLDAVAQDNLYFIPPELLQRQTPRALDGAESMCRFLEEARQK